jgi:transposase
VLYHAWQVKALPGRPETDKLDSVWLAKITERGSLPGSFVPPEDIRRLRTRTRYRRHLVQACTAEKARCEKLLEDAHLKLSSVISDVHGVAGREMLTAIIAGQRDPRVLAQMARTRMRGKIPQLEEALDCSFFTQEHAFILQMMLASIDHLTAQVKELSAKIAVLCEPCERQVAQLDAVPGFGIVTAQDIIGETGVDMSVFPTAGHLCSWARLAPRVTESGGRRKGKNATGRGNPYLGGAPGEAAANAGRTSTFPGTKYRRLVRQMPKNKAQGAISRTQLVITHALLSDPEAGYTDLGTDYYQRRADIRRQVRNHARAIERHGCKVTIEPLNPDPGTSTLPVTKAS